MLSHLEVNILDSSETNSFPLVCVLSYTSPTTLYIQMLNIHGIFSQPSFSTLGTTKHLLTLSVTLLYASQKLCHLFTDLQYLRFLKLWTLKLLINTKFNHYKFLLLISKLIFIILLHPFCQNCTQAFPNTDNKIWTRTFHFILCLFIPRTLVLCMPL